MSNRSIQVNHVFMSLIGLGGNYAQEASQYGPTRGGGLPDSGFGATAAPGAPANVYGGDQSYGVGLYESMGRGGSNATRGYHPYGR